MISFTLMPRRAALRAMRSSYFLTRHRQSSFCSFSVPRVWTTAAATAVRLNPTPHCVTENLWQSQIITLLI